MKFNFWSIVALLFTLSGTVLNSRKNIWGFYIWIIANLMWLIITWSISDASLTIQYLVFLILNFYGIWQWKKKEV
jgi:nicotinamide riboside transporter PnuC